MTTFLFRGLVIGFLAAIALLVATVPGRGASAASPRSRDALVDVSRRAAGTHVADLLGLEPGERVIAIDDHPAATDDIAAAWELARPGGYIDLTVATNDHGSRRVLLLVHR